MPKTILRLNRIKVINNREWFSPGEVKIFSYVTSEDEPLPNLDEYFLVSTGQKKLEILMAAAAKVISSKFLMQINHVIDGQTLIFGDTGYSIHEFNKRVDSFNWQMTVAESDDDVRAIGAWIDNIIVDPEFEGFLINIAKLAQFAINPTVTLSIAIGKYVLGKVADCLLKNKDDQLGVVYQSFYRDLDFPSGDRQAFGIPDLSGNLRIDYRIYAED